MKNKILITMLFPLLSSAAFAASFAVQDENNDGNISKDEWYGSIDDAGIFRDWDGNSDGMIDEEEYALHDYDYDFNEWDVNDDNQLDDNEFNDGWFNTRDDDENGHWDGNEWDDAGDEGLFDI